MYSSEDHVIAHQELTKDIMLTTATLTLEDGYKIKGESFGYKTSIAGEVVFNTGMVGYPENLTDPSYRGQILVLTYPLVGNYGVPKGQKDPPLYKFFESAKIQVSALLVCNYSTDFSHWNAYQSLGAWLKDNKVPALTGIDTRALTKRLREKGSLLGKIEFKGKTIDYYDPNKNNLVQEVSIQEKHLFSLKKKSPRILLVDCGTKLNIIRCLQKHDVSVLQVPWDHDFLEEEYDGLFISNGPGDPKKCTVLIERLRKALQNDKPIFGICLGHQLLALAAGADTYKLKYGHRSQNQPALLKDTKRCYMTSQNHGYAVDDKTLPEDWEPWFINLNDGTNEGIKHKTKPFFSVQFHPEASAGPVETEFLFNDFITLVKKQCQDQNI